MRYLTSDRDTFTLAYHTAEEWAVEMKEWLIKLKCSKGYAEDEAARIRSAEAIAPRPSDFF